MTISIESRMCVYRALIKTMNSCTCPVVRDMLLDELFRQYRLMIASMEPRLNEFQGKLAAIRAARGEPTYNSGCGDVS